MGMARAVLVVLVLIVAAQWARGNAWSEADRDAAITLLFGAPFIALLAWWWFHAPTHQKRDRYKGDGRGPTR